MLNEQTQEALAVAVVTLEGEGVCELKNLAVSPSYQRKGLGSQMVEYLFDRYKDSCHTMFVGTGDSQQTVSFYRSCGFTYSFPIFSRAIMTIPSWRKGKCCGTWFAFGRS